MKQNTYFASHYEFNKVPTVSQWDNSNLFTKYFLCFMLPILKKGLKGELKLEDIWPAPKADGSRTLGKKLEQNYKRELAKSGSDSSFARALWITFRGQLVFVCIADFCAKCIAAPVQSISLGWIVRDVSTYYALTGTNGNEVDSTVEQEAYHDIVTDAMILIIATLLATTLSHPFLLQASHIGMKMRVASCYMLYKKSLKLSQAALSETTVGQMVNLLSNDVNRFDEVVPVLPYLVIAPSQAIIVLTILSTSYVGFFPTLASFFTILVFIVIQTSTGIGFNMLRERTAIRTDERIRIVNEIILAMRIIKMYAWEKPFKMLLEAARKREIRTIGLTSVLKAINQTLFFVSFEIILSSAIITYVMLGNRLVPEVVFVLMSMSTLVSLSLTMNFPVAVSKTAETFVTCKRINSFLQLQSTQDSNDSLAIYKRSNEYCGWKYSVIMEKVYCSWSKVPGSLSSLDSSKHKNDSTINSMIIRDLSLTLGPHELLIIVGRVGSGKSSVLMAMLGELPQVRGELEINGRISYASQEAWIFAGSVKDNILLDNPYLPERYAEVLRVCSLERDLKILVDGDATIVGERGVSLSGGQRARVNLARALYAEADIYLLDDPLSAVDGPVAQYIFNESLRSFLRKKTVVLATHQLQFLRYATKVLVVDRKQPAAFGPVQEVFDSDAFKRLNFSKEAFQDALTEASLDTMVESPTLSDDQHEKHMKKPKVVMDLSTLHDEERLRKSGDEQVNEISTNVSTYRYYLEKAGGIPVILTFLIVLAVSLTFMRLDEYFLSLWSDSEERKLLQGSDFKVMNFLDELDYIGIVILYVVIIAICMVANFIRAAVFFTGSYLASVRLHRGIMSSVIYAPMTFFDFSPVGILLNRLSRDIGFIDEILPETAIDILIILGDVFGSIIVIIILDYTNLLSAILLLVTGAILHTLAASTIIKLKQMDGVTRSPIFSHVSTTISGLSTIRASNAQTKFMQDFDNYQDKHSSVWFCYVLSCRWLCVAMDLLCTAFLAIVVITQITISRDASNASLVGLLISQVIIIPSPFQYGIYHLIQFESQMTSVERVKEFSDLEPEEARSEEEHSIEPLKIVSNEIKFENVTLSYFEDEPPVLKNVSFTVKPCEKIGIVGRTGAGKSSIVSALFRLYNFEGSVKIDGIDTKDLSLAQLRRTISIIPQEPVLFGGTIRKNLDPFDEYSDEQIWSALEAVQLKSLISQDSSKLTYTIQEGGSNFSVGQRQLICLARAIVRRNQVLVLDEATANVDPETDVFIQQTISKQFANCTVITIAHRLITIVNVDRVLVLDFGEVKEFATPYELVLDEKSIFSQMVEGSTGQADRIKERIKEEYEKSNSSSNSTP